MKGKPRMKSFFKFALSSLLMSFALFASSVLAQTASTGSIEGTVTDQVGAAVSGVAVKVTSTNLISAQTAVTDESGRYWIRNLPPGRYTVTVEAEKEFGKFERPDVEVNLSSNSTVEIQLHPASAEASVISTADAAVDV